MAKQIKTEFLKLLKERYGTLRKLDRSLSLYAVNQDAARIYIRYSKVHDRNKTFYGLREEDLCAHALA